MPHPRQYKHRHAFRNMGHRNVNVSLSENFWGWFATGPDSGLIAISKSLSKHKDEVMRKAAIQMIGHMCPGQGHASHLFSTALTQAFPGTNSCWC